MEICADDQYRHYYHDESITISRNCKLDSRSLQSMNIELYLKEVLFEYEYHADDKNG